MSGAGREEAGRARGRAALVLLLLWIVAQTGLVVAPAFAVVSAEAPELSAYDGGGRILATPSGSDLTQLLGRPDVQRVRVRVAQSRCTHSPVLSRDRPWRRVGHRPAHPARRWVRQGRRSLGDPPH
jgi:hypothetical protein